jgi:DNA modification methylase
MLTRDRINFNYSSLGPNHPDVTIKTYVGDARNLNLIEDESIHLIATHPPYAYIIPYSKQNKIQGDLSAVHSIDEYINGMREIAKESYRVLKPGKYAAILVEDIRKYRHHVPNVSAPTVLHDSLTHFSYDRYFSDTSLD